MPFIDGETLREQARPRDPARHRRGGAASPSTWPTRSTTPTSTASSTATSSPRTSCSHDGRPMVADFGIALAVSAAAGGRMTETGLSLGTPHYMSPEQATAEKEITARSDVYSLGSVLYEMLTGDPPHMRRLGAADHHEDRHRGGGAGHEAPEGGPAERGGRRGQGAGEAAGRPVRDRQGVRRRPGEPRVCVNGRSAREWSVAAGRPRYPAAPPAERRASRGHGSACTVGLAASGCRPPRPAASAWCSGSTQPPRFSPPAPTASMPRPPSRPTGQASSSLIPSTAVTGSCRSSAASVTRRRCPARRVGCRHSSRRTASGSDT